jgi:PPOX class probable F420-dependent enzyme
MSADLVFDPANEVHARVLARLSNEQVAWLGTIGRDGYPHSVPIWFLWRDGRAIILSEPQTAKVRNIRENDKVLVHLEAGPDGEQLAVLRGVARLSAKPTIEWLDEIADEYGAKYAEWMPRLDLTVESMAKRYTTVIEVTPHSLIAW